MNNNCIEEIVLWEYIDGEMTPEDKVKLEEHLRYCKSCYDQYLELTSFDISLAKAAKRVNNQMKMEIPEMEVAKSLIECPIKSYWLNGKQSLFWTILTIISVFSVFGALTFVAIMMPHLGVSNFNIFGSIMYKFAEFFLSSSALLGIFFMFLFVYNMFKNRIKAI